MDSAIVFLTGRLVQDPRVYGEDKTKRALFTIAVNRGIGEKRQASFIDCIAWGKRAGIIEGMSKGNTIFVQGQLQQDSFEKQMEDGTMKRINKLQVNVDTILEGKPRTFTENSSSDDSVEVEDGVPF